MDDDIDAVSDERLSDLGLPACCPFDARGSVVPHSECQAMGKIAFRRRRARYRLQFCGAAHMVRSSAGSGVVDESLGVTDLTIGAALSIVLSAD